MFATAAQLLSKVASNTLDAILPPRCLACGDSVDRQGGLCSTCWLRLSFISQPCCDRCGLPFEHQPAGAGTDPILCGGCIAAPPAFERARAALVYDDASRPLVLGLKRGDQTWAAATYGIWMNRAGRALLAKAQLLVPIPLHRWRLFRRRYNQAALLALATGHCAGLAVETGLLVRHRATRSQGGLDRAGRQRNLRGAFQVRPGSAERVAGKRVVVIDDVLTTGATVTEAAGALLAAGATAVDVLTLARVVRD